MRSLAPRLFAACAAMLVALSCGDVPTLDGNIAYVSAIELPSIAVVAGDQLRDSLGNAAPLRVSAFDRSGQIIPGVTATWYVSPLDPGIRIDARGFLSASDSIRTVHVVARIGDRLQTTEALLYVVPKPDQIVGAATTDSLSGAPAKRTLQVTVTGTRGATRSPTQGVVVRYQITAVNGSPTVDQARVFLVDDANNPLRTSATMAIDTTDASGVANRSLTVSDTTGIRTIEIRATARPLRDESIAGNPVTFLVPLKKGP